MSKAKPRNCIVQVFLKNKPNLFNLCDPHGKSFKATNKRYFCKNSLLQKNYVPILVIQVQLTLCTFMNVSPQLVLWRNEKMTSALTFPSGFPIFVSISTVQSIEVRTKWSLAFRRLDIARFGRWGNITVYSHTSKKGNWGWIFGKLTN